MLITAVLSGDRMTLPLRPWAMTRTGFSRDIKALVTVVLAVTIALAVVAAVRIKPARFEEQRRGAYSSRRQIPRILPPDTMTDISC